MKSVLFVTHTLDFEAGGAERVLCDVLERIDRSRFQPSVFSGRDTKGIPNEFTQLDIPIETSANLPMNVSLGITGIINVLQSLIRLAWDLSNRLKRDRPDVVHINSVFALHFALWPCLRHRVPVAYHEHGLARDRSGSPWALFYSFLVKRVSHTIAITDAVRDQAIEFGAVESKAATVYNGIDAPSILPERQAHEPDFRIVQVANFLSWKGQDIMVRALPELKKSVPHVQLVFHGHSKDHDFEEKVRSLVVQNDLEDMVEFGGFRKDLQDLLRTFDCLVVASSAEPFGLVLLEAMRAGIPVVASAAGGVPEIVTHELNGLLFEAGDPVALAKALERIASDSSLASRLRKSGLAIINERFSFAAQIKGIQEVFERLTDSPSAAEA